MKLIARIVFIAAMAAFAGCTGKEDTERRAASSQTEKLNALEQAFKAGVLTEAEYKAKKKELEALQASGKETQQRLEALRQAVKEELIDRESDTKNGASLRGSKIRSDLPNYGLSVDRLSEEEYRILSAQFGQWVGVRIAGVKPNSVGARAGAQMGDIILMVDDTRVASPEEFQAALIDAGEAPILEGLRISSTGKAQPLELTLSAAAVGSSRSERSQVQAYGPQITQGQSSGLAQALIGTWEFYQAARGASGSVSKTCTFHPNGTYEYTSMVSISVNMPGGAYSGGDREETDRGRWMLRGNTLYLQSLVTGQQTVAQVQMSQPGVLISNGETCTKQ